MDNKYVSVSIDGKKAEVLLNSNATVFSIAPQLEIDIPTSCLGKGTCQECLIEIREGAELLSSPEEIESHLECGFRFACQAKLVAPGTVECHTLKRTGFQIEAEVDLGSSFSLDPYFKRQGGDVVSYEAGFAAKATEKILGLAMDLGTTTVALSLVDLETGHILSTRSFENPQRFGGSDVLSRVRYDSEISPGKLQKSLLAYLRKTILSFGIEPKNIWELVVSGNSAMRDMFFGFNVYSIGQMPYRSITEHELRENKRTTTSLVATPRSLGLPMNPKGRVYALPLIGSHVGADTTACLLHIDMKNIEKPIMLIDIGTNTEIVLGTKDKLLAASCPAGPAFEGCGIKFGMAGIPGAIEHLIIEDGRARLETIGKEKPLGLCGSGLIDGVSELLRNNYLNELGRYFDDDLFVFDEEKHIVLSEQDLSQLAQAKAANVCGQHIVCQNYPIEFEQIDKIYLAGGFAKHMSVKSAQRIGLIPDVCEEKIVKLGNASLMGSIKALLSVSARQDIESLVRRVEHVELESCPYFFEYFAEGVQFKPYAKVMRGYDAFT